MSSQSRGQNDGPPARSPETAAPHHRIGVAAPYRLDLTVSVLRRLSTNLVDVIAPTGEYCRVLDGVASGNVVPIVAHVRQSGAETLVVTLNGGDLDQQEVRRALKLLRRSLGVNLSGAVIIAELMDRLDDMEAEMDRQGREMGF